mmetsp:Transcript_9351/g.17604  ORF Transcript_9351/g.17604 Transcript_9351/m.17604 type:complete len:281 (-) Transcript_9351:46-888(-)
MIKTAASILLILQSSQAFSPHSNLIHLHHGTFLKYTFLHSSSSSSSSGAGDASLQNQAATSASTFANANAILSPNETDIDSTSTSASTVVLPLSQPQEDSLSSPIKSNDLNIDPFLQTNTSVDTTSLLPTNSSGSLAEEILAKEKRVHVTIKYSNIPGLRPYFLTIANKIKSLNPDVIVEKQILPIAEDDVLDETVFEVLVDDKVVVGKSSAKFQPVRRSGKEEVNKNKVYGMSVYVSMGDVNAAIGKARKKRRPTTSYLPEEEREKAIRLEMLRGNDEK